MLHFYLVTIFCRAIFGRTVRRHESRSCRRLAVRIFIHFPVTPKMVHSDAVIKKWYTDVAFYWDFCWDFNGINWGFSGYSLPGIGENCWCLMQKNITGPLRPPKKKPEESQPPVAKKTGFPQLSSSILESLGRKSNHFQNRRYAVVNGFFSVDRIIENDHGKLSLFFSQLWGCITLRRWFKDRVLPEKLGISSLIKLYGGFHKRGEP